jgi:predicted nucleic acid-binding protein
MMVVVADTSPINYLILIGEIGVLQQLYHRVVIPEEVFSELMDTEAPPEVRGWATQRPVWIEIRKSPSRDAALADLDAGEASAIALAAFETDVLLLIDESAGRLEASRRGIPNTGTLGVLRRAAIEHLVDLPSALNRLLATNFRVSKPLVADLLAEAADRTRQGD